MTDIAHDDRFLENGTRHRFTTKDSGERVDFPSGMRRDTDKGKPRYDLIPLPMLKRLAELYARGAEKYGDSNWTLANSEAELQRFKASGFRHFVQFLSGDRDEDHMAATVFNLFAAETIAAKLADAEALEEHLSDDLDPCFADQLGEAYCGCSNHLGMPKVEPVPGGPCERIEAETTPYCCKRGPLGFLCTEPEGHAGEHIAEGTAGRSAPPFDVWANEALGEADAVFVPSVFNCPGCRFCGPYEGPSEVPC